MLQETHALRLRYDRKLFLRVAARIVVSAVLGCTVTEGLYLVDNFRSYGPIRDGIIDVLTFPGFVITCLFDLVGVHVRSGSFEMWWAFFFSNSFFYAVVCYFVLDVLHLPPEHSEF